MNLAQMIATDPALAWRPREVDDHHTRERIRCTLLGIDALAHELFQPLEETKIEDLVDFLNFAAVKALPGLPPLAIFLEREGLMAQPDPLESVRAQLVVAWAKGYFGAEESN